MSATEVMIPEQLANFVATQLHCGHFASASDVVISGLRLLEEHELKIAALRQSLTIGEESGYVSEFDFGTFMTDTAVQRNE